jgi:hypothetical protein
MGIDVGCWCDYSFGVGLYFYGLEEEEEEVVVESKTV